MRHLPRNGLTNTDKDYKMAMANRGEGLAGGSRGVGGITGGGAKNVNPVNKQITTRSQNIIDELRKSQGWKKATPAESQAVKTVAKKNSIERIKKGMG
jgi:hypothetical protein